MQHSCYFALFYLDDWQEMPIFAQNYPTHYQNLNIRYEKRIIQRGTGPLEELLIEGLVKVEKGSERGVKRTFVIVVE